MAQPPHRKEIGRRVIDISQLVNSFQEQEGEVQQIIGKTGMGKTYEGTRRALKYLRQGHVVYTTWLLDIPKEHDQRDSIFMAFWNLMTFRKRYYVFDFEKNWYYLDIDRPDLIEFLERLTDAIVFLDEGQDIFDSYEGTGLRKSARKSITRTRHMRKTLIIISQRAQAVAVTARANVTFFYKCVKRRVFFWDWFKVYYTEDVDSSNFPIWEEFNTQGERTWRAPTYHSGFGRAEIYNAYNSWYLRAGIPQSQTFHFEAYDLNFSERFFNFLRVLFIKRAPVEHIDITDLAKLKYSPVEPLKAEPVSTPAPAKRSRKLKVKVE